jgi:hypothetical protein
MLALLSYLEACDRGVGVAIHGIRKVETGIRIEIPTREREAFELGHVYSSAKAIVHQTGDPKSPGGGLIEDVGMKDAHGPADSERKRGAAVDRVTNQGKRGFAHSVTCPSSRATAEMPAPSA